MAQPVQGQAGYDTMFVFDLADLMPGCILLVNISTSIISLLPEDSEDTFVLAQRCLTEAEMRMLLPLLDAPTGCKSEVLHASATCTYAFLLQALLSPDGKTRVEWGQVIEFSRLCLVHAQQQKAMRQAMRGVYNALSGLRQKLGPLGLGVRVCRDGYYLVKDQSC